MPTLIADTLSDASLKERDGQINEALLLYKDWLTNNSGDSRFNDVLFYSASLIVPVEGSFQFLFNFEDSLAANKKQEYYSRIAQLYVLSFQNQKAAFYYKKASQNENQTINYNYYLKYLSINYQMGEIPAINEIDTILLSSNNLQLYIDALIFKAEILQYNGEFQKAATILEQSSYRDQSPEIQLALWQIYLNMNNLPAADSAVKDMKSLFPDSLELKIMEGEIDPLSRLSEFFLSKVTIPVNTYIQVGNFSDEENVRSLSEQLKRSGFDYFHIEENQSTKIIVVDSDSPESVLSRLRGRGFDGFKIDFQKYPE